MKSPSVIEQAERDCGREINNEMRRELGGEGKKVLTAKKLQQAS